MTVHNYKVTRHGLNCIANNYVLWKSKCGLQGTVGSWELGNGDKLNGLKAEFKLREKNRSIINQLICQLMRENWTKFFTYDLTKKLSTIDTLAEFEVITIWLLFDNYLEIILIISNPGRQPPRIRNQIEDNIRMLFSVHECQFILTQMWLRRKWILR